jgi:hypothetical protein
VSATDPLHAGDSSKRRRRTWLWYGAAIAGCAVVTFALVALLMTMFDRKQEAKNPYVRVVVVDDNTTWLF